MAAAFYSQKTKFTFFIHLLNYFLLLYNQTQSPFAFIPREPAEPVNAMLFLRQKGIEL